MIFIYCLDFIITALYLSYISSNKVRDYGQIYNFYSSVLRVIDEYVVEAFIRSVRQSTMNLSAARSHKGKSHMKKLMQKIKKGQSGATAIEYGLIAALIAVVLISSLSTVGNNIRDRFNSIGTSVAGE